MTDLKACPFCGGKLEKIEGENYFLRLGCSNKHCVLGEYSQFDTDMLIKNANTRPVEDELKTIIEQLKQQHNVEHKNLCDSTLKNADYKKRIDENVKYMEECIDGLRYLIRDPEKVTVYETYDKSIKILTEKGEKIDHPVTPWDNMR